MQGEDDWNLWHANLRGTETEKYVYPAQSEFVGDGRGGVWVLCPTTGVEGVWRLWQWHASDHAERDLYEYPADSQLVGDGRRGRVGAVLDEGRRRHLEALACRSRTRARDARILS